MEPVIFTSTDPDVTCKRRLARCNEAVKHAMNFSRGYGYLYLSFDLYEKDGFAVSITKTDFSGLRAEIRYNTNLVVKTKIVEFPEKTQSFVLDVSFQSGEKFELFYSNFLETFNFVSSRKLTRSSNQA